MDSSTTPAANAADEPELRDPPAVRPDDPSWGLILLGAAVAVTLSLILFAVGAITAASGVALVAWLSVSHGLAFWAGSRMTMAARRRQRDAGSGATRDGAGVAARLRPLPLPIYRYAARRNGMFRMFGHRY